MVSLFWFSCLESCGVSGEGACTERTEAGQPWIVRAGKMGDLDPFQLGSCWGLGQKLLCHLG